MGVQLFPPLRTPTEQSLSCVSCCSRMQEPTPQSSSQSKSALALSPVDLLVKGGQYGELVLPSLPPPGWRRREGEELVCGTAGAMTGRQNSPTQAVLVWSEGGEEQGGGSGRAWQHSPPFKVEESVSSEPHLEVDREVEPKTGGIEETGQNVCGLHGPVC